MIRTARAPLVCLLAAACGPSGPEVQATLRIELPQMTPANYPFVSVVVEQSGEVVLPSISNLVATFNLQAGVPANLSGSVLETRPDGFAAYGGTQTVIPRVGDNEIDMPLVEGATRSGDLSPAFNATIIYGQSLTVTIIDEDSGTQFPGFNTGQVLVVPADRRVTFVIDHPTGGAPSNVPLPPGSPFGTQTADLGAPPILPSGTEYTNVGMFSVDDLLTDPAYAIQCSTEADCLTATTWVDCSMLITFPSLIEGSATLLVRYTDAPAQCSAVNAVLDKTPPLLDVVVTPGFIAPGQPLTAGVQIISSEPLDLASISVTMPPATTNLCTTPMPSGSDVDCPGLDLTGASSGIFLLRIAGQDLAGNTFDFRRPLNNASALPPAGIQIVGMSSQQFPAEIGSGPIPIGIDVANLGVSNVCDVEITNVILIDEATMAPALDFFARWGVTGNRGPEYIERLGGGAAETLWMVISGGASVGSDGSGDYVLDVQVSATDCAMTPITGATAMLPITLLSRPVRWLADRLVLSSRRGDPSRMTEFQPPLWGGTTSQPQQHVLTTSDPGILDTQLNMELQTELIAQGIGTAFITATDPGNGSDATTEIEVAPGTHLMLLADTTSDGIADSLIERPVLGADVTRALDPAIGSPSKVLWDATRDLTLVVGSTGVQTFGGAGPVTHPVPCLGQSIIDGTLSAAGAGHSRPAPDLALLISRGASFVHCEMDPVTGAGGFSTTITGCQPPVSLVANVISGQFTAIGANGCTESYRTQGTFALGPQGMPGTLVPTPTQPRFDPFDGYLAVAQAPAMGIPTVTGARIGNALDSSNLIIVNLGAGPSFGSTVIEIDPHSGAVFVGSWSTSQISPATFQHISRHVGRVSDAVETDNIIRAGPMNNELRFVHSAYDVGSRTLYLVDEQNIATPPPQNLHVIDTGDLFAFSAMTYAPQPLAFDVVDLAIKGPQPVRCNRRKLSAGDVATITGLGFAGDGSDEVFVGGVPASVIHNSAHALTFVVPAAFRRIRNPRPAQLTVRTQGLVSGDVPGTIELLPPTPRRSIDGINQIAGGACGGMCTLTDVYFGPADTPVAMGSGVGPFVAPSPFQAEQGLGGGNPTAVTTGITGRRIIGFEPGQWFVQPVPTDPTAFTMQIHEPVMRHPAGTTPRVIALSPDETVLAAITIDIDLYWANDFFPHPGGTLPLGPLPASARLAFTPSGDALIGAHSAIGATPLTFHAQQLDGTAATVTLSGCPMNLQGNLLDFSSFGPGSEMTLVLEDAANVLFTIGIAGTATSGFTARCLDSRSTGNDFQDAMVGIHGDWLVTVEDDTMAMARLVRVLSRDNLDEQLGQFYPSSIFSSPVNVATTGSGNYVSAFNGFDGSNHVSLFDFPAAP